MDCLSGGKRPTPSEAIDAGETVRSPLAIPLRGTSL